MEDNYSAWLTSSHHTVATCNDCHAPHDLLGKYPIKATNGFFHSLAFTTGDFPTYWPEQELRDRVEQIQTRFYDTRQIAMDALVDLIHDIKAAKDAGATDAELQNAWQAQRKGGFSIDFLVSENSMGFHADQYSVTEFAEAINTCRQGQLALRRDVKSVNVQFPSIPETQLGQPTQDEK
jgi:nitrite reductase (cytochrome c-552)